MILSDKKLQILILLSKVRFATRIQICKVVNLGGKRNANKTLQSLSPLLHTKSVNGSFVYYLNKKGCDIFDIKPYKANLLEHSLILTDFYIKYRPSSFKRESPIFMRNEEYMRCDASFIQNNVPTFVEIDRLVSMQMNRQKLEKFAYFSAAYEKYKQIKPEMVFVITVPSRKDKLEKLARDHNVRLNVVFHEQLLLPGIEKGSQSVKE